MKLYPSPPTPRFYLLLVSACILVGISVDHFFGGSAFGYFSLGLPLLLWVWDKVGAAASAGSAGLPAPAALVAAYGEAQIDAAQTLPIDRIFGDSARPPGCSAVRLADVYVPLDVADADPDAVNDPEFRRLSFRREAERAVPLVEALARGIDRTAGGLRAVLLGEAGGGKSSVVGDLLYRCAHPGPAGGGRDDWPPALRDRSVLRLDLGRLGLGPQALSNPSTRPFWRAVAVDLCTRVDGLDPETDPSSARVRGAVTALRQGLVHRGLLLLDGLDEVLDPGHRRAARDLIERLAAELGAGCAVLVTARPYVYPDHALRDFFVWQLQPLSLTGADGKPSQVEQLVANWHRALDAGDRSAAALTAALAGERGRGEMATRPLLLTLLIALGIARGRDGRREPLPADRAALVDEATALFVSRWFSRIRDAADDLPEDLPKDLIDALDEPCLRRVLQRVSLQAQQPRHDDGGSGGGDDLQIEVWQGQVFSELAGVLPDRLVKRVEAAQRLILERAGLLFPRGPGIGGERYGYVHRLFQEYLAACELVAVHHGALADLLGRALSRNPGAWREVARFTAVRLSQVHGPAEAMVLVRTLLAGADRAGLADRDYQAAASAGLALEDLIARLPGPGVAYPDLDLDRGQAKKRLDAWLRRLVDDPAPGPGTRRDLGRIAGRLGDPRPGVVPAGWTPDPNRPFELDPDRDLDWIEVPPGPFRPGSDQGEPDVFDDELGGQPVELGGFRITRYPITQAQFAAFTRDGGYGGGEGRPPSWWRFSDEAEEWWQGGNPGLERYLSQTSRPENEKQAYRDWVAHRPRAARRRPWFLDDPAYRDWVLPNHPVIGVSWFEAMAFCGWLTERLGTGERIRLPTEIEWERAARGRERRRWPWGDAWEAGAANTEEAGLGSTTAVGLFPGAAPEGGRDLAGNVWEWTLTRWGKDLAKPDHGYPVAADDRDDPGGDDYRIVRGGSWYDTSRVCLAAFRNWNLPLYWNDSQGFRVVRVSPGHSDS